MKLFLSNIKIIYLLLCTTISLFGEEQPLNTPHIHLTANNYHGFIENKGQIFDQNRKPNSACLFLYTSDFINLQLRKTGFSYDVYNITEPEYKKNGKIPPQNFTFNFHRIDIELIGCNQNPSIKAIEAFSDYFNYYNVNTPVLNVKQYKKVVYQNIYNNIDIEFLSEPNGEIKYNFIIHPGGKVSDIQLKFSGGDEQFSTDLITNTIQIKTAHGKLVESIPESWLKENEQHISLNYKKLSDNLYGFTVNTHYPTNSTLVIDPLTTRSWATYYGGSQYDGGIYGSRFVHDLTVDNSGAAYFTASTTSTAQIASSGAFQGTLSSGYDAFIVKINCDGTRAWATYYGGSGSDYGHNLSIDNSFLYMVGTTDSPSGLGTPGSHQPANAGGTEDLFLVKFDLNGNRQWGTYYGGFGWDYGADVAVSNSGDIYISGGTGSTDGISTTGAYQPVFGGVWDSFIAKFSPTGTRIWGTYYGSSATEAYWSTRVTTDNTGNVYLSADVWANNTEIASPGAHQTSFGGGSSDAFLVKFNSSGVRLWGTFYGGSSSETYGSHEPFGIKTDAAQNVYFYGTTSSPDNIATTGTHQTALQGGNDVFLAKFNNSGTRLWGTYYGGSADESGYGIALDNSGAIYISGTTASSSGIATPGAYDITYNGGGSDGFFSKFSANGILQSGSYYGGSGTDRVNCIVTDGITQLYLFGETDSPSDIATTGSFQPNYGGGASDAFLVKFLDTDNIKIQGSDSVCTNSSYTYTTATADSLSATFNWIFPAGTIITSGQNTDSINVIWGTNYSPVIIEINYPGLCTSIYDTLEVTMNCPCTSDLQLSAIQTNLCDTSINNNTATASITTGTPPYTYTWFPSPGGGQGTPNVTGLSSGIYSIKVYDSGGCSDSTTITISPKPKPIAHFGNDTVCLGNNTTFTDSSTTTSGTLNSWNWNFGDGSSNNFTQNPPHQYSSAGNHNVTLIVQNTFGCSDTTTKNVTVYFNPVTNFTLNDVCLGDSVVFTNTSSVDISASVIGYLWVFNDGTPTSNQQNPHHYYATDSTYNVTLLATTNQGCSNAITKPVNVFGAPQPQFTTTNVCMNNAAAFINNSLPPTMGTIGSQQWDFGDNSPSSIAANPQHLYATPGTYPVTLIVRSSNLACADTLIDSVTVFPVPNAAFTVNPVCLGQSITCNNTSSISSPSTITSWSWNFGDNSPPDTSQHPTYSYSNFGSYHITLIATTNNACNDTISDSVIVHPLPLPAFTTYNVCENSIAQFIDQSIIPPNITNDGILGWTWDFGNSSATSNNQNASQQYTTIGTDTVELKVVSNFGCIDSIIRPIVISPNPIVNFTVSDTIGCEPLCIIFQDASTIPSGNNASWLWTLGDSTTNTDTIFTHCYFNNSEFNPISYTVSLKVTSDSGCTTLITRSNYITVYPKPVAAFITNPDNTTIANPVTEVNDHSTGTNAWNWNFGDNDTSTVQHPPPHTYADTGAYTIQLIASTNYGCKDTTYNTIVVEPDYMLYIPNSFTPNNDGLNDTFIPQGIYINEFEMLIFNRWGNLVYKTDDITQPWNGKTGNDNIVQADVYVYVINIKDYKLRKHRYKGTITITK